MKTRQLCNLVVVIIIVACRPSASHKLCSTLYGSHEPCTFLPAPPGKTPPCAQPGSTYCEYPEHYPSQRIQYLIQQWRFDHHTLIRDESKEDFHAYYYPAPSYKYGPPNGLKDSYFPEPIHIPKPQYPFEPAGKSYIPPSVNASSAQLSHYKYSSNIPAHPVYGPPPNIYTAAFSFAQAGFNKLWARKDDKVRKDALSRKRRSVMMGANLRKLKSLHFENSNNGTRAKRQSALVGQSLCTARSQYIMPRAALNNQGNWMFVVNMPEMDNRYSQLVKSETCAGAQTCALCQLPVGYSSRCEQKYVQKRLVALEPGGNGLYNDVFWFPSCCVCTVSNT